MIAIPNMEKPKSCKECESFCIEFYMGEDKMGSACTLNDDDGSTIEADYNSCPLIEIVTCGECKHRDSEFCQIRESMYGIKDNDFCSYGERRNDGTTN